MIDNKTINECVRNPKPDHQDVKTIDNEIINKLAHNLKLDREDVKKQEKDYPEFPLYFPTTKLSIMPGDM